MAKLCRRISHFNIKRRITWRVTILRRCLSSFWNKLLACWLGKSPMYNRLLHSGALLSSNVAINGNKSQPNYSSSRNMREPQYPDNEDSDDSSDLVDLKISILGDSQMAKQAFWYVGKEDVEGFAQEGVGQMDKTLRVNGARISHSIWEVPGDYSSVNHVPNACKGSVAILFMFDLTSRCTLNSILGWYRQARQYNQNAIPVLIGTKFDEFIQLPLDLQWTIASQARAYAKALNATLFFSSATYNINVNKIFKYITARLFDLPWTIERNLTIGEPIIDF